MKTSRIAYYGLVIIALLLALCATSCRATRQIAEPGTPSIAARAIARDSTGAFSPRIAAPATFAGFTDAIGLSTAEGRERRQLRKDATAMAPRNIKVKNGAFSWGGDAVAIGKKAGPSVVESDSSVLNAVTGGGNLQAVSGNDNELKADRHDTTKEAPGPLAVLANNATAWLPWVLGIAAAGALAYGVYYFWFLIPRRKTADNTTHV